MRTLLSWVAGVTVLLTVRIAAADSPLFFELIEGVAVPVDDQFHGRTFRSSPVLGVRGGVSRRRPDRSRVWPSLELTLDWTALRETKDDDRFPADFQRARLFVGGRMGVDLEPDWSVLFGVAAGFDYIRAETETGTDVVTDRGDMGRISAGILRDFGPVSISAEIALSAAKHVYRPIPCFSFPYESYDFEVLFTMRTGR